MYETCRHEHWLARNVRTSTPSNMVFLDSETLPYEVEGCDHQKVHRLRLWCASHLRLDGEKITREHEATGTTPSQLWDWVDSLTQRRKTTWLFAHNLPFDLTVCGFWQQLLDHRYELESSPSCTGEDDGGPKPKRWEGLCVLSDPPTIIECRNTVTHAKLVCVDTLNYWRCSLERLGASVGVPKYAMPRFDATDDDWRTYCWRDVEVIEKAVLRLVGLVREHDWGNFRYTISGQAWQAFRHKYMKERILVHGNRVALDLERAAYYGGQCSLWRIGIVKGPIFCLDKTAFYPSVMRNSWMPVQLKEVVVNPSISYLSSLMDTYWCVARVIVTTTAATYPVRHEGRTVMARGTFTTTLADAELRAALVARSVESVSVVAYYRRERIFRDFVDELWRLRLQYKRSALVAHEELIKTLMNSLFGKFGQLSAPWVDDPAVGAVGPYAVWPQYSSITGRIEAFRSIDWRVQRRTERVETGDSVPAIAAAVTSLGRTEMARLRDLAGWRNVYYQDTDSLHCDVDGYSRLLRAGEIDPIEMGKLKVTDTCEEMEYRGLKYYRHDDKWVVAGVKAKAEQVGAHTWRQLEFQGLQSILSSEPTGGVLVTEREVTHERTSVPGVLTDDGWVDPITI